MISTTIRISIVMLALVALQACTARKQRTTAVEQCPPPKTLTCDRFAGKNYNCSCERGGKLRDILDVY